MCGGASGGKHLHLHRVEAYSLGFLVQFRDVVRCGLDGAIVIGGGRCGPLRPGLVIEFLFNLGDGLFKLLVSAGSINWRAVVPAMSPKFPNIIQAAEPFSSSQTNISPTALPDRVKKFIPSLASKVDAVMRVKAGNRPVANDMTALST